MTEENVNTVEEEVEATEETTEEVTETPQPTQVNPREVLLQVFEQGARATDDWERSQLRIQCILALQQTPELVDVPRELRAEVGTVLSELLKGGQLTFPLQQILYPMVKELES